MIIGRRRFFRNKIVRVKGKWEIRAQRFITFTRFNCKESFSRFHDDRGSGGGRGGRGDVWWPWKLVVVKVVVYMVVVLKVSNYQDTVT